MEKEVWVCTVCGYVYDGDKPRRKIMEKEVWVCTVCGYVYDGEVPFEQLPEDWVCPVCGEGKEVFEKRPA